MELATAKNSRVVQAREHAQKDKGFSFTRRTIALMIVFSAVLVPLLGGALYPDMPISYGYQEMSKGWLFSDPVSSMQFSVTKGITILPIYTEMLGAVIGLYFGKMGAR